MKKLFYSILRTLLSTDICPTCGSTNMLVGACEQRSVGVSRNGQLTTQTKLQPRWHCNDCGVSYWKAEGSAIARLVSRLRSLL